MVIISSHWKPSFPLSKDEIRLQVSIIEVQAEMPIRLNSRNLLMRKGKAMPAR
jgi:hypothetical protein